MDFRGLVWNRCRNYIFWSEIGSGFGEPGSTTPPRIPRGTPRDSRSLFEIARTVVSLQTLPFSTIRYREDSVMRIAWETVTRHYKHGSKHFMSHFSCAVTIVIFFLELIKFFDKDIVSRSTWDIRYSAPHLIFVWKILSSSSSRPYLLRRFCFCSINLKNRDWIEQYVHLEHYLMHSPLLEL